jgi:hypothetical protein
VHNWSVETVASWVAMLGYPQYARAFKAMRVDGRLLPSLAMDQGARLRTMLRVKDDDADALSRAIIGLVFGIGARTWPPRSMACIATVALCARLPVCMSKSKGGK